MNTNFEYQRIQTQSKIRALQQEGIVNQQLRMPAAPKASPAAKNQKRQWLQTLKSVLSRPVYS